VGGALDAEAEETLSPPLDARDWTFGCVQDRLLRAEQVFLTIKYSPPDMIKTAGFQVEGGEMSNLETMKRMFDPKGIAVIGASQEPGKVGYSVVKNLVDGGYKGKIFPINPKANKLQQLGPQ